MVTSKIQWKTRSIHVWSKSDIYKLRRKVDRDKGYWILKILWKTIEFPQNKTFRTLKEGMTMSKARHICM